MKKSKQILMTIIFVICASVLKAETLFEIKDSSNNTVFNISEDGLRVFNLGDTLMVISADAIRANISSSKGLSRSFSVTTTSSVKGKGLINALQVEAGSTSMSAPDGEYTNFSPENIFLGLNAGESVTTGEDNVIVGNNSGTLIGEGRLNVLIGANAGNGMVGVDDFNYHGWFNTFIGYNAGANATNSSQNTYIGTSSGYQNTDGESNTFLGSFTGQFNQGICNTFIGNGVNSGGIGAGSNNTFMGWLSGNNLTSGCDNTCIGDRAGYDITTGNNNVSLGYRAGYKIGSGEGNVMLGYEAGFNETGSNKLYIDNSSTTSPLIYGDFSTNALTVNGTLYATGNTSLGGTYLRMISNPSTGAAPTNYFYQGSTGSVAKEYAFSIYDALWVTDNAFFDTNVNVAGLIDINGTGSEALRVDGLEAIWLGQNVSLQNYFSWGYGALYNYFADRITIGNANYNSSYMLYVNGSAYATGVWNTSDKRFKKNITGITGALNMISRINGVKYDWRSDEFKAKGFDEGSHYGVIAQEIEEVVPEAVKTDSDGYKAVAYDELVPILIEAVKELKKENETLKTRLETLEIRMNE